MIPSTGDTATPDLPARRASTSRARDSVIRELSQTYGLALTGYVTRITGDRGTAQDVVQETLLRAWQNIDRIDGGARSMRAWLFRVAHNLAVDRRRARQAVPTSIGESALVCGDHAEDVADAILVRHALGRLSPQHRCVLYHCFYLGYTVVEAAGMLDIPVGTAKSRLYYAVQHLREQFPASRAA